MDLDLDLGSGSGSRRGTASGRRPWESGLPTICRVPAAKAVNRGVSDKPYSQHPLPLRARSLASQAPTAFGQKPMVSRHNSVGGRFAAHNPWHLHVIRHSELRASSRRRQCRTGDRKSEVWVWVWVWIWVWIWKRICFWPEAVGVRLADDLPGTGSKSRQSRCFR